MKRFFSILFICFFPTIVFAEINVIHNAHDIQKAMALISDRLPPKEGYETARVQFTEKGNAFFQNNVSGKDNSAVKTSFRMDSGRIEKYVDLAEGVDQYGFTAALISRDQFHNSVHPFRGGDALIFDNNNDMFIYTQSMNASGQVELKEWIYARTPNSRQGSRYRWHFVPQLWRWPLTVEMDPSGQISLYRNMPVYGVTFNDTKRRQHVAGVVDTVMTQSLGSGNFYFPFHDKIADMAAPVGWTLEGRQLEADVRISDEPMAFNWRSPQPMTAVSEITKKRSQEKHKDKKRTGPDWSYMVNHRQNIFEVYFKADPKEYPILIDPTLIFNKTSSTPGVAVVY